MPRRQGTAGAASVPGYINSKPRIQARLSRLGGQVRGIRRMVDNERYCIDILTQVNAVKAALDKVAITPLDDHVQHCVARARRRRRREGQGADGGHRPIPLRLTMFVLQEIGKALSLAFAMFWQVLWPLGLGFLSLRHRRGAGVEADDLPDARQGPPR